MSPAGTVGTAVTAVTWGTAGIAGTAGTAAGTTAGTTAGTAAAPALAPAARACLAHSLNPLVWMRALVQRRLFAEWRGRVKFAALTGSPAEWQALPSAGAILI